MLEIPAIVLVSVRPVVSEVSSGRSEHCVYFWSMKRGYNDLSH